jgi:hypothetical protein
MLKLDLYHMYVEFLVSSLKKWRRFVCKCECCCVKSTSVCRCVWGVGEWVGRWWVCSCVRGWVCSSFDTEIHTSYQNRNTF